MAQTIELNDVVYPAVEGEHEVINDYYFYRLGAPIPIVPGNGGDGDPMPYHREYLPSQALAVSERFELLFVAHPSGFVVAPILDVMLAHVEGGERSVRSRSIAEVPVGRVRLLSLSPESSTLAACVGGTVNLFSVESLRGLEPEPFLSTTIDGGRSVKDMMWLNNHLYILLTSCRNLYFGSIDGPLQFSMDEVDAVDCSPRFDYIAVARNDELRIFSPSFDQAFHIALSLQPWTRNSDDFSVKVDSLKWACPDRIILGCFQLTLDGMEESYLLLVIGLTIKEILEPSVAYVQSFHDVFPGIVEDIMPAGSGPHLFFSCLRNPVLHKPTAGEQTLMERLRLHDLPPEYSSNFAIAANRKNVDQHVVLFDWCHREQMARVYIDRDYCLPRIELQENGDDNSILGLCTENTSQYSFFGIYQFHQHFEIHGNPICTLWCLSLEGKLSVFGVTRYSPLPLIVILLIVLCLIKFVVNMLGLFNSLVLQSLMCVKLFVVP